MTYPANIFRDVVTWQRIDLAALKNSFVYIERANKKFKNFQDYIGQLGATITFELPPKVTTTKSLKADWQGLEQRYQALTVDEPRSTAVAFNTEDLVFNDAMEYHKRVGEGAMSALGTDIESYCLKNLLNYTYRFYGDGTTPINTANQLARATKWFKNYGSVTFGYEGILPDIESADIVSSALNQFVLNQNERLVKKWEIGTYAGFEFFSSNLLPEHRSGPIGDSAQNTLTVVSTNDPTGQNITSIVVNVDPVHTDVTGAILKNSVCQFIPNDLKSLTFTGYAKSQCPVQIRITADVDTVGTTATLTIDPALRSVVGNNQNISRNIVAGDTLFVAASHRAGFIYSGQPLLLGMPRLPMSVSFPSTNSIDKDSGAAIRLTYGESFGEDERGFIWDLIFGSAAVKEQIMRVCFPINNIYA